MRLGETIKPSILRVLTLFTEYLPDDKKTLGCALLPVLRKIIIETVDMEESTGTRNTFNGSHHSHTSNSIFVNGQYPHVVPDLREEHETVSSGEHTSKPTINHDKIIKDDRPKQDIDQENSCREHGFRRIIRNFTPS